MRLKIAAVLLTAVMFTSGCSLADIIDYHWNHGHGQALLSTSPGSHNTTRLKAERDWINEVIAAVKKWERQRPPNYERWVRVAVCESGLNPPNWSVHNPSGIYHGGLQFSLSTWRAYGGTGDPHTKSANEQIRVAERVRTQSGLHHWPHCGSRW